MARSNIIFDLINKSSGTITSLRRLKAIVACFDQPDISQWIDREISGYQSTDDIPAYRYIPGVVLANATIGVTRHRDIAIPMNAFPDEISKMIKYGMVYSGIGAIEIMLAENRGDFTSPLPPEFHPYIYQACNVSRILSAKIKYERIHYYNILESINSIILDVLLMLEKEFGCLDGLEVNISSKPRQAIQSIYQNVVQIALHDPPMAISNAANPPTPDC